MFLVNKTITSLENLFNGCKSLIEFNDTFIPPNGVSSYLNTFKNCTSLKKLNDNFKISEYTTIVENLFYNCINLEELPSGFTLSETTTSLSGICFDCRNLKTISETFWPVDGFKEESAINIESAFYNCEKMSGTVPQYKLWKDNITWISNETNKPLTFKNCRSLNNYIFIPTNWRW